MRLTATRRAASAPIGATNPKCGQSRSATIQTTSAIRHTQAKSTSRATCLMRVPLPALSIPADRPEAGGVPHDKTQTGPSCEGTSEVAFVGETFVLQVTLSPITLLPVRPQFCRFARPHATLKTVVNLFQESQLAQSSVPVRSVAGVPESRLGADKWTCDGYGRTCRVLRARQECWGCGPTAWPRPPR